MDNAVQGFMRPERPTFSVIIPTYNRPVQLSACLEALVRQDYPRDLFEVIIGDDGGSDPLEDVVLGFRGRLDIKLLRQAHGGPAAARNTGAARARGRFLAFTDDDCSPAADWLKALAARLAADPEQMIGGQTLNALRNNPYSRASQAIVEVAYVYLNAGRSAKRFFASNNLALRKDLFCATGCFDATFTTAEDRDFCGRWLHHGRRMTYAPEAVVRHNHALNLRSYWRQHFNYGRGAFRFHQARARRGAGPFKPELKFYVQLMRYPLAQKMGWESLHLLALLAVGKLAELAGFVTEGLAAAARRAGGRSGRMLQR